MDRLWPRQQVVNKMEEPRSICPVPIPPPLAPKTVNSLNLTPERRKESTQDHHKRENDSSCQGITPKMATTKVSLRFV